MLTGDLPYRQLMWLVLRPGALARLGRRILQSLRAGLPADGTSGAGRS